MLVDKTYNQEKVSSGIGSKAKDLASLFKIRLNLLVVFSTIFGYLLAAGVGFQWPQFWILALGGFLVVGAANGLNQIIERNSDKLMRRTQDRPVARGRLGVTEATVFCTISGILGVLLIGSFLNPLSASIAALSLLLYAFAYTPLKKVTPLSVFVGAFPGAFPPLIGYSAFTGEIGLMAIMLFGIQFFWQFPHFWAIAWVMNEDYQRAGFRLLPLGENKDRTAATQILMFTILLLPLGLLPAYMGHAGLTSAIVVTCLGLIFSLQSAKLYWRLDDKSAKELMFGSFLYLPLALIVFWVDQIFI